MDTVRSPAASLGCVLGCAGRKLPAMGVGGLGPLVICVTLGDSDGAGPRLPDERFSVWRLKSSAPGAAGGLFAQLASVKQASETQ